jgi:MFS family permease
VLAAGSLADLFGRRRVFRSGVALFVIGSFVGACCCAYWGSPR